MEEKKIFLLDAYALIYRAYFAFSKNPRINSKGLNTSAIYGFSNTLIEVLEKENPTHIAVVFDAPGPTFRHEMFPAYKANRDAMPEDIQISIPYIKDLIKAFNIPVIQMDGYEADDIIGTLAHKADDFDYTVYMMTPDKDYAQLVREKVKMYRPSRGGNGPEIWGVEEVKQKFEIDDPIQVIDILAMWGDAVDNIPGIPGIGEKTAKKLVGQYGSVEGLYEHTDELKGKQKEKVEANKEQAFLSKELATINVSVPVEFDESKLVRDPINQQKLEELFNELEFRTLLSRLFGGMTNEFKVEGTQMNMFDTQEVSNAESTSITDFKSFDEAAVDYRFVASKEELSDLIKKLNGQSKIAFDTETSGLDALTAKIVGASFSFEKGNAFYIDLVNDFEAKIQLLKAFFTDYKGLVIGQNLKYDLTILHQLGIPINFKCFDTMLAHYLIDPEQKHGMDFLAELYLNYRTIPIESLIGKKGKSQQSMADIDPKEITNYACEDADITFQLYECLKEELEKAPKLKALFENIEVPLLKVLLEMESEGVRLDTQALAILSKELEEEELQLEQKIRSVVDFEFNVNSPKQLGEVLFDHLKLDAKAKKTKTGQYVTSEETLQKLAGKHEVIDQILIYRGLKKLRSTYVDALPLLINSQTNKIHTSYNQAVAATGRLSSNNPNLQNIPIRSERGKEVRKAFVPSDENHVLLAADYSQVELRIMAELSKDEGMCEAFQKGLDIHAATAAKVFGVELEEVTREMRGKAKTVNFGIIYGISAFGLSQRIGISRTEAKEIIENYFMKYPGVKSYMDNAVKIARDQGYVETIMGRKRYLADINSRNAVMRGFAERNAINAPIQGSAADIIKKAMIDIQTEMKKRQFKSKMILQVHDELIFDAHLSEVDELQEMVKQKMKNAVHTEVPLEVDANTGRNWLEAH